MSEAPKGRGAETGLAICAEIIEHLRQIEGVAGIHVMTVEGEERVREIVQTAGLLPRPTIA
jgi:methylenetetrahydrofolate reductase (NADPH)